MQVNPSSCFYKQKQPQVFYQKAFLKDFEEFTGKHLLWQSPFLKTLQAYNLNFFEKETMARNSYELLRTLLDSSFGLINMQLKVRTEVILTDDFRKNELQHLTFLASSHFFYVIILLATKLQKQSFCVTSQIWIYFFWLYLSYPIFPHPNVLNVSNYADYL